MAKISADQQRWQAESDAHTMATYQEIISDKARMRRAISAARTEAAQLTRRASAMQSAAKCPTGRSRRK